MTGDFHTHSVLDDGTATLDEMAAAARRLGLSRLGLSGHSYCPEQTDFCLASDRVADYMEQARRVQRRYAGQPEILVGMELDLFGSRPQGLDYVIGSVHSICRNGVFCSVDESAAASARTVEQLFGGDWYRYTDAYYDHVARLPEQTGCDWIGHFDLVTKFNRLVPAFDEQSPRYLSRALEVMEYLVRRGVCFEINTGAMARGLRGVPYPEPTLLRRLCELGGEVVFCSDAHAAEQLCYGFWQAAQLAQAAGFRHRLLRTAHGFEAVGLFDGLDPAL